MGGETVEVTNDPFPPPPGPFDPTWASLEKYKIPRWYQEDKFGIFIHWGVYSVPAFGSEWYPRNMYIENSSEFSHHLSTYGPHTEFGYKDFIPQLTAANFDPHAWADLFREAGARFVVPVAEHHDGFSMYNSSISRWNALKLGPRRDVIGELGSAVRDRGLVFGVSCHRAEHWWFFNGGWSFPSDVQDPRFQDLYGPAMHEDEQPDAAFLEDWLARCCELVDKYQPQVFYFDWWIQEPAFKPYLRRFAAHYYNRGAEWGKGVAIDYKFDAFPERAAVLDVERGQLADIRSLFWQTDTSVSRNSWGYVKNQDYKDYVDVIHDLVDVVSKNGALLLNIGPMPDGTIPAVEQTMLREVGAWLKLNGIAIYGTRPWRVYGEGPTHATGGSDQRHDPFTCRDIRFTVGGGVLYATALVWPDDGVLTVCSLGKDLRLYNGAIKRVTLLGHDGEPLEFQHDGGGLRVTVPKPAPAGVVTCSLKIEGDAVLELTDHN